jgi:hypothetical protein
VQIRAPTNITVTGSVSCETIVARDVLFGDVIVCSGQVRDPSPVFTPRTIGVLLTAERLCRVTWPSMLTTRLHPQRERGHRGRRSLADGSAANPLRLRCHRDDSPSTSTQHDPWPVGSCVPINCAEVVGSVLPLCGGDAPFAL